MSRFMNQFHKLYYMKTTSFLRSQRDDFGRFLREASDHRVWVGGCFSTTPIPSATERKQFVTFIGI
jgi:hypothetical protein